MDDPDYYRSAVVITFEDIENHTPSEWLAGLLEEAHLIDDNRNQTCLYRTITDEIQTRTKR